MATRSQTARAVTAGAAPVKQEPRNDFIWDYDHDEPHADRRKAIIKAHPEVSQLMGIEWRSKYIAFFVLCVPQIWLSIVTVDLPWLPYFAIAYFVGATITQANFLAHHELSHNLFFKSPMYNRLFSFVVNFPLAIPFTISFRQYHIDHHKHQGIDGIDTDIPSRLEGQLIRGPLSKVFWACCQILTYALRPSLIKPMDMSILLATNWVSQIAFDAVILYFYGWKPLAYMVLSILLAGGLHPCAGHFISEHYVFPHLSETQETYSYYGSLNALTWNVGYHNEHHDFPFVPWSRLPALKRAAPEFYNSLAVCESWCGVIWDYILRDDVGPYNRVKRPATKKAE